MFVKNEPTKLIIIGVVEEKNNGDDSHNSGAPSLKLCNYKLQLWSAMSSYDSCSPYTPYTSVSPENDGTSG